MFYISKEVYHIESYSLSILSPNKRCYKIVNQNGKTYAKCDNYIEARTICRKLNEDNKEG